MSEFTWLGHTMDYWQALEKEFRESSGLTAARMLEEIITLRGKVSFYESRIKEMYKLVGAES